jgi:hypothetical protein
MCRCESYLSEWPMQAAGWQAPCENSSQPKPSGVARCDSVTAARALVRQMGSPQRAVLPPSARAGLGRACGRQPDRGARGYPSHDAPELHMRYARMSDTPRMPPPLPSPLPAPSRPLIASTPVGVLRVPALRTRCALVCEVRWLSVLGPPALCTGCVLACAVQRLRALHLLIQFVVWSFVAAFVVGLATLPGTPRYRRTRHTERRQGKALCIQ